VNYLPQQLQGVKNSGWCHYLLKLYQAQQRGRT
jgi:hypothetical protein